MIVYDIQAVQSIGNGERGIARYVGEVARALARRDDGAVDIYAWNDALPFVPRLDELGLGDRLQPFSSLRSKQVDILHIGSPFELMPYGAFRVPVRPDRTIITCYDLIPYRFPAQYLEEPMERARYEARLTMLLAADEIVTDSESAADDVATILGYPRAQITSIGAGVSDQFRPPHTSLDARIASLRKIFELLLPGFVLVPTGMDWRKNTRGAMRAFSALPESVRAEHQLVVVCRATDDQLAELSRLAVELGIGRDIIFTGLVTDDELVLLYQSAELVFFPSFYEGFGLPVLEARRCGARVICSNTSSLPEVLPDPTATFNPHDLEEMTHLLERALVDVGTAARLSEVPDPGFSWDRTADDLVGVYRRALNRVERPLAGRDSRPTAPCSPLRIGVAVDLGSPLDGERSGGFRPLLYQLSDHANVTAFVASDASGWCGRLPIDVRPLSALQSVFAMGDLDVVVYLCDSDSGSKFARYADLAPGHLIVGGSCPRRSSEERGREGGGNEDQAGGIVDLAGLRYLANSALTVSATCPHHVQAWTDCPVDRCIGRCDSSGRTTINAAAIVDMLRDASAQ